MDVLGAITTKMGLGYSIASIIQIISQIILFLVVVYGLYYWVKQIIRLGFKFNIYNVAAIISILIVALVFVVSIIAKLTIDINSQSISYKLYPLHSKYRKIKREDIDNIKISNYVGLDIGFRPASNNYILEGKSLLIITPKNSVQIKLSTDLSKKELLKLLKQYNYTNIIVN